jgi:Ser/Thr protein kinase RdoA (MazF antagonist)
MRLREDAYVVPDAVLDAFGLAGACVKPLNTGSYNIHFKIVTGDGDEFDLRKSNRPSEHGNLLYETEVLTHLSENGFDLAPKPIPAKSGDTNLWINGIGWTLFRWMGEGPGKMKPVINGARIRNAATVLADIHRICRDFVPTNQRADWPIFTLPTVDTAAWLWRAKHLADHLHGDGKDLLPLARRSARELCSIDFTRLPEFLCHGDYRMRNLQFAGDDLTGVFDFDTSIRASRLFDLGGAATRFSPLGGDPQADIESGAKFLTIYHRLSPLSEYELEVLPIFIRWRLLREVVVYFDYWWLQVRDACTALFDGAADSMVEQIVHR